jgi:hypothetical protein
MEVIVVAKSSVFLILCLVLWGAGCSSEDGTNVEARPAKSALTVTWVAIEPVQCLGNPWEQDWLENNGWDYDAYPKDPTRPGLEPEEFEIIRDYYARQGVVVFEGRTAPKYESVCLACSCPEGHTLYLLVRDEDAEAMIGWGYRLESPE